MIPGKVSGEMIKYIKYWIDSVLTAKTKPYGQKERKKNSWR